MSSNGSIRVGKLKHHDRSILVRDVHITQADSLGVEITLDDVGHRGTAITVLELLGIVPHA